MPAIPESTRSSILLRLLDQAEKKWPQLAKVQARYHGSFAYITGVLPGGEQIPLFRLRYGGSAHSFGFAIYSPARDRYEDAVLLTGLPIGSPQEALDTACTLHLAALGHEPGSWPPTDLRCHPLSNIYLHKLDEFVEQELIPQYTRGTSRRKNPGYSRIQKRLENAKGQGNRAEARNLKKQLRAIPCGDPADPGYRRLRYTRYADDHLLGFAGPKSEAEEIKTRIAEFLRETLGLELNRQKTLITHARSQRARFLGYDITVQHDNTKLTGGRRSANGNIALKVPPDVIKAQCARYRQHGKPWHRSRLQNLDDYDIVRKYGAEYQGVVNYYLLAQDVYRLNTLHWNAMTSMLKTLAAKHHSTVSKTAAKYKAKIETRDGLRTCFEARRHREGKKELVARFGGIILRQDRRAVIRDPVPAPAPYPRKELVRRLRKQECELCETGTTVAVHQVTGLRELGKPGPGQPAWAALMAKMRRKTLIVCAPCHDWIHANPVAHAA